MVSVRVVTDLLLVVVYFQSMNVASHEYTYKRCESILVLQKFGAQLLDDCVRLANSETNFYRGRTQPFKTTMCHSVCLKGSRSSFFRLGAKQYYIYGLIYAVRSSTFSKSRVILTSSTFVTACLYVLYALLRRNNKKINKLNPALALIDALSISTFYCFYRAHLLRCYCCPFSLDLVPCCHNPDIRKKVPKHHITVDFS